MGAGRHGRRGHATRAVVGKGACDEEAPWPGAGPPAGEHLEYVYLEYEHIKQCGALFSDLDANEGDGFFCKSQIPGLVRYTDPVLSFLLPSMLAEASLTSISKKIDVNRADTSSLKEPSPKQVMISAIRIPKGKSWAEITFEEQEAEAANKGAAKPARQAVAEVAAKIVAEVAAEVAAVDAAQLTAQTPAVELLAAEKHAAEKLEAEKLAAKVTVVEQRAAGLCVVELRSEQQPNSEQRVAESYSVGKVLRGVSTSIINSAASMPETGVQPCESSPAAAAPATNGVGGDTILCDSVVGTAASAIPVVVDTEVEAMAAELEAQCVAQWSGAVPKVKGLVWRFACSARGTHVLQKVFANASAKDKVVLARELEGHVTDAWESTAIAPHANYVLQKCIEVLPPGRCAFVRDELLSNDVIKAAHSKYGCRILQRLIEHFPNPDVAPLVNTILEVESLWLLMVSRFGNFVVQCVLEHGSDAQKAAIAGALCSGEDPDFARLAENKYASHVVQHAMKHCCDDDQSMIVQKVLTVEASDPKFKRSVYGSFVATEAKKWKRLRFS